MTFLHVINTFNPFKKPIVKSTIHFRVKNKNHKIEVKMCQNNLNKFTQRMTNM